MQYCAAKKRNKDALRIHMEELKKMGRNEGR